MTHPSLRRVMCSVLCVLAALAGVAFSSQASRAAEPTPAAADACATTGCRTAPRDIQLTTRSGSVVTLQAEARPYVEGDTIIVYAGETVTVSFPDGDLGKPQFVSASLDGAPKAAESAAASPTLSFILKQTAGKPDMILTASSKIAKTIKYDATMHVLTSAGLKTDHTSTCPIIASGGAFEMWQDPILMIEVSGLHEIAGNKMSCD